MILSLSSLFAGSGKSSRLGMGRRVCLSILNVDQSLARLDARVDNGARHARGFLLGPRVCAE